MSDFPLIPDRASTVAGQVDLVFFTLTGLSIFFTLAVAAAIIFLALRYREGANVDRTNPMVDNTRLELTWSVVPFIMAMGVFAWATIVYVQMRTPPPDAIEVYVIGKQWMWHAQHPSGKSEINNLHVPIDTPVKVILTSQDVIHSFFVPAFRVKQDAVPGRYTYLWFEATTPGEYHLFCAEYCGTDHSVMGGTVTAMEPIDYEDWLRTPSNGAITAAPSGGGVAAAGADSGQSMAQAGEALFQQLACNSCHAADGLRAPVLAGVFGTEQPLADGSSVQADEQYVRESILNPQAKVVEGYTPIMPSYDGQVTEQQLVQLVEYIKSLQ